MIKIGITSCFMYPDKNRTVFGPKMLNYIENDMARFITKKGILPVLIPDVSDEFLYDILEELDGFVLQGGSDLAPETYGETPIGKWKGDYYRDQYELKILDFAVKKSMPVLGVCRGFQLMNAYFGGTLFQDTATQKPETAVHRSAELYDTVKHAILLTDNALLQNIYESSEPMFVNSVHHQAIKELGSDLEVYATSTDGLIEAFGYTKEPEGKVMGVQWHPEFSHTLKNEVLDENVLFKAFLQHTKQKECK